MQRSQPTSRPSCSALVTTRAHTGPSSNPSTAAGTDNHSKSAVPCFLFAFCILHFYLHVHLPKPVPCAPPLKQPEANTTTSGLRAARQALTCKPCSALFFLVLFSKGIFLSGDGRKKDQSVGPATTRPRWAVSLLCPCRLSIDVLTAGLCLCGVCWGCGRRCLFPIIVTMQCGGKNTPPPRPNAAALRLAMHGIDDFDLLFACEQGLPTNPFLYHSHLI